MKSEMCKKAGLRYWLGLLITVVVACGMYVGVLSLANAQVQTATRESNIAKERSSRGTVMKTLALAVLSWKVQHGALPDAKKGTELIEQLRRFQPAETPKSKPNEAEAERAAMPPSWGYEHLLAGPTTFTYQPKDGGRFELTATGPEMLGDQTILFGSDGIPVRPSKGASDG